MQSQQSIIRSSSVADPLYGMLCPLFAELQQRGLGRLEPRKRSVALCVGIVSLVAFAQVDKDNKVTGFKYEAFDVESVSTPGVTYVKPKSGGGWD